MDEPEDVRRATTALQTFSDRIEDMLAPKPTSAGTTQLIAATAQLKADIKDAEAGAGWRRTKGRKSRADDQLETAISRAVTEFRMRAETDSA
jgi:hypothetical protein